MDLTMLVTRSRRAYVEAAFNDDEDFEPLQEVFEPSRASVEIPTPLSDEEEAEILAKGTTISEEWYLFLGNYLLSTERRHRSVYSIHDKRNTTSTSPFLPPTGIARTEVLLGGRVFSTRLSHGGNSAVQFIHPENQGLQTGNIEQIWQLPIYDRLHTFFIIRLHRLLPLSEERKAPFCRFQSLYSTRIVDLEDSDQFLCVEPQHIRTHLSTFRRPPGTYGIPKATLVICWALNRGRR